jgi:hypothetical protein
MGIRYIYNPLLRFNLNAISVSEATGDMEKTVYDTDDSGVVDAAESIIGGFANSYYGVDAFGVQGFFYNHATQASAGNTPNVYLGNNGLGVLGYYPLNFEDYLDKATYDPGYTGIVADSYKLGSQLPSYYLSVDNHVAGTVNKLFTSVEKVKLASISGTNTGDQTSISGIAGTKALYDTSLTDGNFMYVGDTASNSSQLQGQNGAYYLSRANHTGTQLASTISDFATAVGNATGNIAANFTLTGAITPPALVAATHNYNPTGLSTANVLFLSAGANYDLTGIEAQENGRVLFIINLGTGSVKLKNNNANSLAPNRFRLRADATLQENNGGIIIYNTTLAAWLLVAIY